MRHRADCRALATWCIKKVKAADFREMDFSAAADMSPECLSSHPRNGLRNEVRPPEAPVWCSESS